MHGVGIIGLGGISRAHYKAFAETGRAEVRSVFDIDKARTEKAAAEWGAEAASSPEKLVRSVAVRRTVQWRRR